MRGGKEEISGIITIKTDCDKEGSSSGDGGRFFFFGWMGCLLRRFVRDMEVNGASRFWETVPKAGRFFCAIVGL